MRILFRRTGIFFIHNLFCLQASLGDSCENKENDELMAEACRQAARQASATVKQKVLAASNGNLAIKGEEEEKAKINGNGTDHSSEAEQVPGLHICTDKPSLSRRVRFITVP